VNPRSGLDDVERRKFLTLPGLELQPLGRPAHSQSLYRLRYPDSLGATVTNQNLIQEEIKRRLNSGNACYHSVHNLLSSCLLSKIV
jgi:hypothetical protein